MSIDYMIHIGPYVVCKNEQIDVKKTRRSCTNENCKRHKEHVWDTSVNFCVTCGSKIGQVDYIEKDAKICVDSEELNEDLHPCSQLNQDNLEYWLPNKGLPGSRMLSFNPKYDEEFAEAISPKEIGNDIEEFKNHYKTAIAKLTKEFGKNNVEVKWGVIFYTC